MKKLIPILVSVLLITAVHLGVFAADPGLVKKQSAQKDIVISKAEKELQSQKSEFSSYEKTASFQFEQETYQFLPELYSVVVRGASSDPITGNLASIQSEKSATLVQKKGHFQIFRSNLETGNKTMTCQNLYSQQVFPVVLNNRTGNLGIVTGMIAVKLKDIEQASDIAADYDLVIKNAFAHLNTAFYSTQPGQDLIQLGTTLGDDSRIEKASIEVLEHLQVER
jgi:Open reading frame 2 N-terminal domain